MSQFDALKELTAPKKKKTQRKGSPAKKKTSTPLPTVASKQPDKPPAKSRDENYLQTGIYIKKETPIAVKKALLDDTKGRDFSDLVEELLSQWISK